MGDLAIKPGLRIGVLSQHQTRDSQRTIWDELGTSDYLEKVHDDLEALNELLADPKLYEDESYKDVLAQYNELQEEVARFDSNAYRTRAIEALKDLSFGELNMQKHIADLSGGERRKVSLGKLMALAEGLDVLLLDEPTNHLDIASIEKLEEFIHEFNGTVILTSHDRYLLDDTVDRIFEIVDSRLRVYEGDFTDYVEQKEAMDELNRKARERYSSERKKTTKMIAKMKARNRFDAQIRSKLLRMRRIKAPTDPLLDKRVVNFKFGQTEFGGRIVAQAKGLKKAFASQVLMDDVEFEVEAGDKIGLIGPNGCGKTTLLKILHGAENLDEGEIFMSRVLKIGYFDQGHLSLNPGSSLIEEMQEVVDNLHESDAKSLLGRFGFRGSMVNNKVDILSGGERARLAILKLVVSPCNLLFLDEPTNHLDIPSRQAVESAMSSYKGTVIMASHDRYFLDAVANRIFDLRGGMLTTYKGNYTEYRSLELTHPGERTSQTNEGGSGWYLVNKKFTNWANARKFQAGEIIRLRADELPDYKWELDSKHIEKTKPPE